MDCSDCPDLGRVAWLLLVEGRYARGSKTFTFSKSQSDHFSHLRRLLLPHSRRCFHRYCTRK